MKSSGEQIGVIFLDREKLDFYGSNITHNVVRLDFPPNIVKDLEVISKDELNILIKNFIDFYKIVPANLILVLSANIYFEKNLQLAQRDLLVPEMEEFLDNIPFKNTASRIFPLASSTKIIAANRDFYGSVKNAFENHGFTIKTVIPEFVARKYADFKGSMDIATYRSIIDKFDSYRKEVMINHQEASRPKQDKQGKSSASKISPTLIVLLGVFILFIGILIFMLVKTLNMKPTVSKQPVITPIVPITNSSPTSLPKKLIKMENVSIKIVNSSGEAEQEELVRQQLIEAGFENIEIEQAGNITIEKTLLVFSHNLPNSIREKVISEMNKIFGDISIQETSNPRFEVIITLTKI